MEQEVLEDLAQYLIRLHKALLKYGWSDGLAMYVLGIVATNMFSGTRNDNDLKFKRLVESLERKQDEDKLEDS